MSLQVNTRRFNVKGVLIAVVIPLVLVGALVVTLLGTGAFSRDVEVHDSSAWLYTTPTGEIARVNGITGSPDTRYELTDAQGHNVQIEQTDRHLLLRDLATGEISAIDLATLQTTATAETPPGEGVRMALSDDGAFIVDSLQGVVRQVDPATLEPIGEPLNFPPGLTGGVFDAEGSMWLTVPREGTLVEIDPAKTGAAISGTTTVADPAHSLDLTVLSDRVAVLDATASRVVTVRGEQVERFDVDLKGPALVPDKLTGSTATVTVTDPRTVTTVAGEEVHSFEVPGEGGDLGAAVEYFGRIYVPDSANDRVYVYTLNGEPLEEIEIDAGGGDLQIFAQDGLLFVNAPNTNSARVVDSEHRVKKVNKSRDDILGGDVPPPPEEETAEEPEEPEEGPPGAAQNVTALAGDGKATLSWDAAPNNGSPLTKYIISDGTGTFDVDPQQRVVDIGDLENGTQYQFTVTAVNEHGEGPPTTSNPVVPTAEVPDPPASVSAEALPDGTVDLNWDEANGQGNTVSGYKIEAVGANGERAPVGQASGTTHSVPAEELTLGNQYAFVVTAMAEGGSVSEESKPSNTVVPFSAPEAPRDLAAQTASDQAGTIQVSWAQPADNGRAITGYRVTAGGQTTETAETSATISGLGDGAQVTVEVVAINEAGESEPASTQAKTVTAPTVSITGTSSTHDTVTVNFSTTDGGGNVSCKVSAGGIEASGNCSSLTVTGLYASTVYDPTVTVTNPAGSAKQTVEQATQYISGKVACQNASNDPEYCDGGIGVYPQTKQTEGTELGHAPVGKEYDAFCKITGPKQMTPYVYHPGKNDSNVWIRINWSGRDTVAYIPFIWFNLNGQGKNSTGALPNCR